VTQLLISVRSVDEASSALAGGADVIDIKEPGRGALGAADVGVWRDVLQLVSGRRPVSCALGELHEDDVLDRARQSSGMSFVKVGLSRLRANAGWNDRWKEIQRALPQDIQLVAVIYADWQLAEAPLPYEIIDRCAEMDCHSLLVDTWNKARGGIFQYLDDRAVQNIVARARTLQMKVVLAGSLTHSNLPRALQHRPDYVGIRGAACIDGRAGRISETLVRQLSSGVRDFPALNPNCSKKPLSIA